MTLRALASNDERIIDYFRDRANRKRTKRKVIIDIPDQLAEKIDEKEFVRELELKAWSKLARLGFMPFEEAREFVQKIGLRSNTHWQGFLKNGFKGITRPLDIPYKPNVTYKNNGWISWGDFLGTGRVASKDIIFRPYLEAKQFAINQKIKSSTEWHKFVRSQEKHVRTIPEDIPADPASVYRNKGWVNWGDFLGTGRIANAEREFMSYEDAKEILKPFNLKTSRFFSFLKNLTPKQKIELKTLPRSPQGHYTKTGEWVSWGDFLGTGNISTKYINFLSYDKARSFVHKLNLKSENEWRLYKKGEYKDKPEMPNNIPKAPETVYSDSGWNGMGDWLGTGNKKLGTLEYLPFADARKFVLKLKLKSSNEWYSYKRGEMPHLPELPENIPRSPYTIYKGKGWSGMGHWLGTGNIQPGSIKYVSFSVAKRIVRKIKLKSNKEWRQYSKTQRPENLPSSPDKVYEEWTDWGDFLGTKRKSTNKFSFFTYKLAKENLSNIGISSHREWKNYLKMNDKILQGIPRSPDIYYKKTGEWLSWSDFLGYEHYRSYVDFSIAKSFAQNLNFKKSTDWYVYCKSGEKPVNIPRNVSSYYKNKGWISWPDFLGYEPERKKK